MGVYSINQPPKWVGATEDGQWQAAYDYNREPDAPGDWLGVIYWQGEGEVFLVDAEFTQNGQPVHKAEFYGEAILTEGHQSEDFIHSFEPMFTNKNDHLQLLIH